jgi:hypothetical protein
VSILSFALARNNVKQAKAEYAKLKQRDGGRSRIPAISKWYSGERRNIVFVGNAAPPATGTAREGTGLGPTDNGKTGIGSCTEIPGERN